MGKARHKAVRNKRSMLNGQPKNGRPESVHTVSRIQSAPVWVKVTCTTAIAALLSGIGVASSQFYGARDVDPVTPITNTHTGRSTTIGREDILTEAASRSTERTEVEANSSWGGIEHLNIPMTMSTSDRNALNELKSKLKQAKDLHESSNGKVDSEDVRNALDKTIKDAAKTAGGGMVVESASKSASKSLDDAMDKVKRSVKAKSARDAEADRSQESRLSVQAQAQANAVGSLPMNNDGTLKTVSPGTPAVKLPSGKTGRDVVDYAMQFIGYPYVWGAAGPNAFDCSGLVMYVYGQFGVSLPHYSGAQATYGRPVASLADAKPGDVLVNSSHAAIYIGDGKVINALNPSEGVRVTGVNVFQGGYSIRRMIE